MASEITAAWMAKMAAVAKANFATTTWGEKESQACVKAALDATTLTEAEKADVMVVVAKVVNPSACRQFLYNNGLLAKPVVGAKKSVDWVNELKALGA